MSKATGEERAADWDAVWETVPDAEDLDAEERGLRWRVQRDLIAEHFGAMDGLQVVEIGAGRATNALMYARQGARATVLDRSALALEQARSRFAAHGLDVELVEADVFALPPELLGRFDVSMSFGLCEHFLDARRVGVVKAHLDLVRSGGLAIANVPNRLSPFYRAWMALAKRRGTWKLETEVPFSGREMRELARAAGGSPLKPVYVGGLGTLVNPGPNAALRRLGRRPLPVPQVQVPVLDYLAYDLLMPITKG
jgi:cyclopropane fatty-acyl-phospholipid synthase-like methyltransferase